MNKSKNVCVSVLKSDKFFQWEHFLNKHFKDMPSGFTKHYYFKFKDRGVKMSKLADLERGLEDTEVPDLVKNRDTGARQAILKELCELTAEATGADIVNAELEWNTWRS